jgi:hypothetical protein
MSIKLDWEIEAERERVPSKGEDPAARRARRRRHLRLLIVILAATLLLVSVAAVVAIRLRYVDWQVENALRDTLAAEVTALRLGDREAFLAIQRSADPGWLQTQSGLFDQVQTLKQSQGLNLTGRIIELAVAEPRARVQVEEIIGGEPYVRTSFYWRYEDGWRHVPPDYTFWGDEQSLDAPGISVRYRAMDAAFAPVLASAAASWWAQGCAILGCEGLPTVTLRVSPDDALQASWSGADQWVMQVPSPYVRLTRLNAPFDPALQVDVARLLAGRLVDAAHGGEVLTKGSDAAILRDAASDWLLGRWLGADTGTRLFNSFAARYGDAALAQTIRAIAPDSTIAVLGDAAGTPIESLDVDWSDFLQARLALEDSRISAGDQPGVLALYDPADMTAQGLALARLAAPAQLEPPRVLGAEPATDAAGAPILRAQVQRGESVEEVLFRLVNGTWLRAS